MDGNIVFFNEAETICELAVAELEDLEVTVSKRPKMKKKKEADLSGLPIKRIDYGIVETTKTSTLKPFDYVQYLLEELRKR